MNSKNLLKILFAVFLLISFQASSAQSFKEEEKTFELNKNGTVSIDTYKGSIDVETWDKAQVYVHVRMEADGESWPDTDPEEQLENVKIKYDASDNSLRIQTKYDKLNNLWGSGNRALVHYKIKMPKTAQLKIDDYKSETGINGLQSGIEMETYKGRVNITGLSGSIDLETYKGDAVIDFAELKGSCKFDTFKGSIELNLKEDSKFDLEIDLGRKGDFSSDFDYSTKGEIREDKIRGTVNGGGPSIEFETRKGDLRIRKK